jgi:hypothetical protein
VRRNGVLGRTVRRPLLQTIVLAGVLLALLSLLGRVHHGAVLSAAPSVIAPVGRAHCQPQDRVETGLQGQVPKADRDSGRATTGYNCNLTLIGGYPSHSFANFDTYLNCAYYSDNTGGFGTLADTGTIVLDVSDPRQPLRSDYLTARAMRDAGESLRVNARRGLLVADHYGNGYGSGDGAGSSYPWLAVYDVSQDCRHPRLLADVAVPHGKGHEGWFSPDGMTYYMSNPTTRSVTPVDLTDPAAPRELATWPLAVHGGSISEDGTRGYLAQTDPDALLVLDTSDVGRGRSNTLRVLGTLPTPENVANQSTYRLDYDGHPYVIDFGELTSHPNAPCPVPRTTNFDAPRMIDVADETHPRLVAQFLNEVDDPANCVRVLGDNTVETLGLDRGDGFWAVISRAFVYDDHYCTPDRLHDPTILACTQFLSGLRVYDIRDPLRPREIAYYNMGISPTDHAGDMTAARPVIRTDLGQIWWVSNLTGFHVVQFENGVWPFRDASRCPRGFDYLQAQYDLGYASCLASRGRTAPAPRAARRR